MSSLSSSTTDLDLTVLDTVGHLSLRNELHYIQRVVTLGLERCCGLTYSH